MFRAETDPHRSMLAARDLLIQRANSAQVDSDVAHAAACEAYCEAENVIVALPAATLEGAFVKMLVLLQQIAMGHSVDDTAAWPIVEEAAALLGSSTLASLEYPAPDTGETT